jgi:hypothetical protein
LNLASYLSTGEATHWDDHGVFAAESVRICEDAERWMFPFDTIEAMKLFPRRRSAGPLFLPCDTAQFLLGEKKKMRWTFSSFDWRDLIICTKIPGHDRLNLSCYLRHLNDHFI